MSDGFIEITETDFGSKGRAKKACDELPIEISKECKKDLEMWWETVLETAKRLCIEFGAFDTFTLYNSIRIEDINIEIGGYYEKVAWAHDLINKRIVAGGPDFINPKTGKPCDYAISVHDGTGKNLKKGPRPFLTLAIQMHWAELDMIINKAIDRSIQKKWSGE